MSVLEVQNVRYQYKNKYHMVNALNGVSCQFEMGKVYAMVGKSGSGKTTLLSILAGLDLPIEGNVVFDGTQLSNLDRDRYRRESVSVIYQTFNLLPLLSIEENVMYPLQLKGVKEKDAREYAWKCIRAVELDPEKYATRLPSMLSGGERQRIAIARALATDAKVILADEPTGNLDEANTKNVMNILMKLAHDTGCCVIIVTHDMKLAGQADVKMEISDGKILSIEEC